MVRSLDKLSGHYTLILKLNKKCVAENVSINTLGVRISDHWFNEIVKELNIPIVTTSVNISNKKHMTCLEDLDEDIRVDFIIYEGGKDENPSKII